MKKRSIRTLCVLFFCSFLCSSIAQTEGVKKLQIDNEAYVNYLKIISYARPLTLKQLKETPEVFEKAVGGRVTILGFVTPPEKQLFISEGVLRSQKNLAPEDSSDLTETGLHFSSEKLFQYKPFQIYQVTGQLEKLASGTHAYSIKAQFSEPQAELSKIIMLPDVKSQVASYPALDWYGLYELRDMLGNLVSSSATSLPLPEPIKKLADQQITVEGWFTNLNKDVGTVPASGTMFISIHNILGGMCRCCGSAAEYAYDNISLIKLTEPLSADLKGGIFTGILRVNKNEDRDKFGFFTLENAILVEPLSIPDQPDPNIIPKIDKQKLLPALQIKPPKED